MIVYVLIPVGGGKPLSPRGVAIVGGLLILGSACFAFHTVRAVISSIKSGKGFPFQQLPSAAICLYGAIFGAVMVMSAAGVIGDAVILRVLGGTLIATLLICLVPGLVGWIREGCAIRYRCPRCKEILDGKIFSSHCPVCGQPLPDDDAEDDD